MRAHVTGYASLPEVISHSVAALPRSRSPPRDGYKLATRLRHKGQKIPALIAITGYGQAEDRFRAQAAGFDYHFVKPVNLEDLLNLFSTLGQPD